MSEMVAGEARADLVQFNNILELHIVIILSQEYVDIFIFDLVSQSKVF